MSEILSLNTKRYAEACFSENVELYGNYNVTIHPTPEMLSILAVPGQCGPWYLVL